MHATDHSPLAKLSASCAGLITALMLAVIAGMFLVCVSVMEAFGGYVWFGMPHPVGRLCLGDRPEPVRLAVANLWNN
jgi:hypothetical protein